MTEFTDLEVATMEKLLEGEDEYLALLRRQWRSATFAYRDFREDGFDTGFYVPLELQLRADDDTFGIGGVDVSVVGMPYPATLVLFVGAGFIQELCCTTYVGPWPDEVRGFTLVADRDDPSRYQRS